MVKIINWGILGTADVAKDRIIPNLLKVKNSRLYGIAGRKKGKIDLFKKEFNPIKIYYSYEEMLEDKQIDIIYIPLPNSMHKEWSIKAMMNGKHVLCEKPLALNSNEVKEMIKISNRTGKYLTEAFAYRYSPLILRIQKLINEGKIGDLKAIDSSLSINFYSTEGFTTSNLRAKKALGGGAIYDLGRYQINLVENFVKGMPEKITALGDICEETGCDKSSSILLFYKKGFVATLHCAFNEVRRNRFEFIGDKGRIISENGPNSEGNLSLKIIRENQNRFKQSRLSLEDVGIIENEIISVPNSYMLEISNFADCIANNRKPLISLESSLETSKIMDKVLEIIFK